MSKPAEARHGSRTHYSMSAFFQKVVHVEQVYSAANAQLSSLTCNEEFAIDDVASCLATHDNDDHCHTLCDAPIKTTHRRQSDSSFGSCPRMRRTA